jgi:hypothetical protein
MQPNRDPVQPVEGIASVHGFIGQARRLGDRNITLAVTERDRMGEAPGVLSVVDLTGGMQGLVGRVIAYWAACSGCVIHFSWQRHPRVDSPIEIGQTAARIWVCSTIS